MQHANKNNNKVKFRFATGGAGFCLSRQLVERMHPMISDGEFVSTCESIRLPDDVSVGFIVEHRLKTSLNVVDAFHSHLEPLRMIPENKIREQISFSYGKYDNVPEENRVDISGKFSDSEDPTRFRTLHCYLHPDLCLDQETSLP